MKKIMAWLFYFITANETHTTRPIGEIRSNVFGTKLKTFTPSTLPEFGS